MIAALAVCTMTQGIAAEPQRLTYHQKPKPLAPGAVTSDWPRFLGPAHNATSPETKLLKSWPEKGPQRIWEIAKGGGHTCPAIVADRLILFHRPEGANKEQVDCLEAETGEELWTFSYAAPYQDRYGAGDGPHASPVLDGQRVFIFGITGLLHCLDLKSGSVIWKRDLAGEFATAPNFFGHGSTPLVLGDRLIINLGAKDDFCVGAFDSATGRQLWSGKHPWGASYASPIPARLHGRECLLVFAGGESRPPTGGLLCIDAADGLVLSATPHRAAMAESVSASSPAVDGHRVFVTESYGAGGALIEFPPDFSAKIAWQTEKFGCYFMTPIVHAGFLYGFHGQHPSLAELVCYEIASGRELWRDDLGGKFQRGSLLAVDGAFLCLGENGTLAWLELSPKGATLKQQAQLFNAPETWTLPAISGGLLYVCQNARSADGQSARLICYDLRAAD